MKKLALILCLISLNVFADEVKDLELPIVEPLQCYDTCKVIFMAMCYLEYGQKLLKAEGVNLSIKYNLNLALSSDDKSCMPCLDAAYSTKESFTNAQNEMVKRVTMEFAEKMGLKYE